MLWDWVNWVIIWPSVLSTCAELTILFNLSQFPTYVINFKTIELNSCRFKACTCIKYLSHKFYITIQKQVIFQIYSIQIGYWVIYHGVFRQNLAIFEKSDLVLFARAENQHNKKLKRRKEKKLSKYYDFSKNLEKKTCLPTNSTRRFFNS